MRRQERYDGIIDFFTLNNPNPESELNYRNAFELLVAVVLSAQCTDKRINKVTPVLFEKYPNPKKMSEAEIQDLYNCIKSVSYPNNKAKHLSGLSKMLVEDFAGEVPCEINKLEKLPGVGHKTANVVASVFFEVPAIAVDTHVYRVSRRVGLVPKTANTPLKVETILNKYFPRALWAKAHHWLILHGRYVCLARKPKCDTCGIRSYCMYFSRLTKEDK